MGDLITLTLLFLAATAFSLVTVFLGRRLGQDELGLAYWERPAISDEEFVRLLDPAMDPVIALKVREIISDVSGVDKRNIYPDARLIGDLGMD